MAIKLTCPGCRDTVEAEEADRGKRIKCGTCWADVDVPAPPVKAVPIPAAKPVPAAPVPAAKPVPTATPAHPGAPSPSAATTPKQATPLPVAAAKPVAAVPLPVAPARQATPVPAASPKGKGKKDEDEPKSKTKKRFQERDDRDDDDDDRRSKGKKGGGGGVLIAFICIGAVMLLGVAGGIAVVIMNSGKDTAAGTTGTPTTEQANNPIVNPNNPKPNGGDFNPNPPAGGGPDIPLPPPPPLRPQGWAEFVGGKNFRCDMPGAVAREETRFDHALKPVSGTAFRGSDENNAIKVTALELTVPANTSATSAAFLASAFGLPEAALRKDPNPRLVNGHPGVEYTATADGMQNAFLTVGVGTSAFLFRYQWKPNTPTADEKRDNFLASVSILLEGDGPPVARNPFDRNDPNAPRPITQPWKPLDNKDGFAVDMPPGVKKAEKHTLELENRGGTLSGKKWSVDDDVCVYHVYYHDLGPDQLDISLKKLAKPLVHSVFPYEVQGEGEDVKVDGKPATRWDVREFNGNITHGVSVRVGYRVFTLFVTGMHNLKGPAVVERQDKFLNSIKVSFDPKTHNPYADEPEWVPMAKAIGFTALIPKQASSVSEFNPFFFPNSPIGKEWKAEIDGITYQVFAVDFSPNPKRDGFSNKTPADLVKWFTDREKVLEGPDNKAKLGNLNAEGYVLSMFGDRPSPIRFVTAGRVVYAAKVSKSDAFGRGVSEKEYADKTARFFNSFRLGEGNIAHGGGAVGPGEAFGGATGDFAKVVEAKVQPFWAAAFLPQKKELLTFGVKDATAKPVRGVLRRYSVPDFKLKATYETPSPINRAVADEAHGRLYVATVREAEDARQPEKENLIATGDVQQYDLAKLTDGSVGEGEQVRPVNVLNAAATAFKVSGLECSEDGAAVYVSGVVIAGTKTKPVVRGGRLMKWETASQKFATDIPTDSPVWALALSADGKRVVALERSMDAARPAGNLVVVDGPGWKRTGTVPIVGTPNDLALRNDRAAVVVAGQAKLLVGPLDGDLTETNIGGEANYLAFSPGGTKLLLSAGGQAVGLTLYEVDNAKPPKLTRVATAGDLSGQFVISPDGKFAVMNVGVVLDLEKSKAK